MNPRALPALAGVDGTIDSRCVCGCAQPIPDGAPSAWFATEACQRVWQAHRRTPAGTLPIVFLNGQVGFILNAPAMQAVVDASLGGLVQETEQAFASMGRAVQRLAAAFWKAVGAR